MRNDCPDDDLSAFVAEIGMHVLLRGRGTGSFFPSMSLSDEDPRELKIQTCRIRVSRWREDFRDTGFSSEQDLVD
jgi:hypothetical protein